MRINRNSSVPLYIQLADILREQINSGANSGGEKLLSERDMGIKYHVSRNTVRSAIRLLDSEGVLHSSHGQGTFTTRIGRKISSRIDLFTEHSEFLRLAGYQARGIILSAGNVVASEEISEKLGLEKGKLIFCIEKLFYADERPAIYTLDYLPATIDLNAEPFSDLDSCDNFMDFLEIVSGKPVEFGMSDVTPICLDAKIAKRLEVPVGSPVLKMTEVFLDSLQQTKIGIGVNYYSKFIKFNILRRRTRGKMN